MRGWYGVCVCWYRVKEWRLILCLPAKDVVMRLRQAHIHEQVEGYKERLHTNNTKAKRVMKHRGIGGETGEGNVKTQPRVVRTVGWSAWFVSEVVHQDLKIDITV